MSLAPSRDKPQPWAVEMVAEDAEVVAVVEDVAVAVTAVRPGPRTTSKWSVVMVVPLIFGRLLCGVLC
jgi:hypothetical protein